MQKGFVEHHATMFMVFLPQSTSIRSEPNEGVLHPAGDVGVLMEAGDATSHNQRNVFQIEESKKTVCAWIILKLSECTLTVYVPFCLVIKSVQYRLASDQTKSILILDILISVYVLLYWLSLHTITWYIPVSRWFECYVSIWNRAPCAIGPSTQPAQFQRGAAASGWYEWPCGRLDWKTDARTECWWNDRGGYANFGCNCAIIERESIVFSLCCAKKTALNCSTTKFSEIRIGKGKKQKVREAPSSHGYAISDINESNDKEAKLSSEIGLHTFYRIFTKAQMIWTPTQQPVPFNRNIT